MHFPIIKLEPIDLAREDWDIDLGYEDATLNENTDYYGELYPSDWRRGVIESKWLKELLEGIAILDTKEETITFLSRAQIEATLQEYYLAKSEELYKMAQEKKLYGYNFRDAGARFRGFYTLFVQDYGKTSLQFVEDAMYHEGETFRIGNIFDAHF